MINRIDPRLNKIVLQLVVACSVVIAACSSGQSTNNVNVFATQGACVQLGLYSESSNGTNPQLNEFLAFPALATNPATNDAPYCMAITIQNNNSSLSANSLQITIPTFKRLYLRRIDNRWALVERKSQNHSCVFYQNQKCQVYTSRPLKCRTYPFWKENLNSEESWKLAAEECEGIHPEAPLFSEECITRALMEQ